MRVHSFFLYCRMLPFKTDVWFWQCVKFATVSTMLKGEAITEVEKQRLAFPLSLSSYACYCVNILFSSKIYFYMCISFWQNRQTASQPDRQIASQTANQTDRSLPMLNIWPHCILILCEAITNRIISGIECDISDVTTHWTYEQQNLLASPHSVSTNQFEYLCQ